MSIDTTPPRWTVYDTVTAELAEPETGRPHPFLGKTFGIVGSLSNRHKVIAAIHEAGGTQHKGIEPGDHFVIRGKSPTREELQLLARRSPAHCRPRKTQAATYFTDQHRLHIDEITEAEFWLLHGIPEDYTRAAQRAHSVQAQGCQHPSTVDTAERRPGTAGSRVHDPACGYCLHAAEHGWWGEDKLSHCRGCGATWDRTKVTQHCTSCHETFNGPTTAGYHRESRRKRLDTECADLSLNPKAEQRVNEYGTLVWFPRYED